MRCENKSTAFCFLSFRQVSFQCKQLHHFGGPLHAPLIGWRWRTGVSPVYHVQKKSFRSVWPSYLQRTNSRFKCRVECRGRSSAFSKFPCIAQKHRQKTSIRIEPIFKQNTKATQHTFVHTEDAREYDKKFGWTMTRSDLRLKFTTLHVSSIWKERDAEYGHSQSWNYHACNLSDWLRPKLNN